MYKFFIYSMLVVLYLGLAKTLSPSELGITYLQNEKSFSKLTDKPKVTFILIDTHVTGFLIKTFYQKYRVISDYEEVEDLIVRSSKEFTQKNLDNIGLSIYRRKDGEESFVPMPPGTLYLNDPEFGDWIKNADGVNEWRFNKSYQNFPKYLGWGDFRPDEKFYQDAQLKLRLGESFYGNNSEFGPEGTLTKKAFPHFFSEERRKKIELKTLLIDYFKENF
jgi:hypothetical protein